MKLFYSPAACSLAPHIALRETGADFTLERVDIRGKKTESGRDFLEINPKGYVPVLEIGDGEYLTENAVMQQYIADRAPSTLAPPRGTIERLRLEELLGFISTEIHKTYSPLFNPMMPDEAKTSFKDKLAQRYAYVEGLLADGRAFLTGETFTIADAYLFTVTNWGRGVGLDLSSFTHLGAYMKRVASRPAVIEAMRAEGLLG